MRRRGMARALAVLLPVAGIASCNLALGIGGYTFEPSGTGGATGSTTTTTTATHSASSSTGTGGHGGQGGSGGQGGQGGLGGQGATTATPLWSERFGDGDEQTVTSIAADDAGNAYVTGWFYGKLDFGSSHAFTSQGSKVGYVASFDASGNTLFALFYAAQYDTIATAVAVHPDGSFTVGGTFGGTLTLPTGGSVTSTQTDAFLANYDKNQTPRWSAQITGSGDEAINAIADAESGVVTVVGTYDQNLQVGAMAPANLTLPHSPGGKAGFVLQVDGTTGKPSVLFGVGSAAPSSGNAGDTQPFGVAAASGTGLAVVGSFTDSASLGDGHVYASGGGQDAFLLQFMDLSHSPTVEVAGGPGDQVATGVGYLPDGALLFGGTFQANLSFGAANATLPNGTGVFLLDLAPKTMAPTLLTVGAMDNTNQVFGGLAGNGRGVALAGTLSTGAASLTLGTGTPTMFPSSGLFVVKATPSLDQI